MVCVKILVGIGEFFGSSIEVLTGYRWTYFI